MRNMFRVLPALLAVSLSGCSTGFSDANILSCNDLSSSESARGVCEGVGSAVISSDYSIQYIRFPGGAKGGIALSLFPEIEDGDRVFVKGSFYTNGRNFEFESIDTLRGAP